MQLRLTGLEPDSRQFLSNFRFLRCRLADASQDEKGEKCRKGVLTGDMGSNPVSLYTRGGRSRKRLPRYGLL